MFSLLLLGSNAAKAAGDVLDEILVTAQKRTEKLQDVPISVQSFDAKALQTASISGMGDMKALIPSVKFLPYPTAQENLYIAMRGVYPSALEISQDMPVAIHIDGVYIARGNGLNMAVADLERVEILKGPQGTLYGRNATAGAINLITAKPGRDFVFDQQLTFGNYGKAMSKTSVNMPVSDTLAVKLSYINDSRDGFIKDSNNSGRKFGDRKSEAARLAVRWKPISDVTVDYGYDSSRLDYLPNINQCLTQAASTGGKVSSASSYPAALCSPDRLDSIPLPNNAKIYAPPNSLVINEGHTLNIGWNLSDDTTFRSITGYRKLRDNLYGLVTSADNAVIGAYGIAFGPKTTYAPAPNQVGDHYVSQEFQLIGKVSKELSYNAGIYYFDEKGSSSTASGALGVLPLGTLPLNILNPAFPAVVSPVNVVIIQNRSFVQAHNNSTAVYGQMTWIPNILDNKLEITPGLRYTKDMRQVSQDKGGNSNYLNTSIGDFPAGATTGNYAGSGLNHFSQTTPSLTIQYHINDDLMGYGKVVKGYKAGGFALGSSSGTSFAQGFGPEKVTSTELGFKGEFFGRRLRTNAAVFQSKYTDQQISVANPPPGSQANNVFDVLNAGKSTYNGMELDLMAAISQSLRAGFNYSYIKYRFDQVLSPSGANITDYFHVLPSKNAYSATLDYTLGKVGPGNLDFHLDYSYVDKTHTMVRDIYNPVTGALTTRTNPDFSTTPSYSLWNGRITLTNIQVAPSDKGNLQVGLWVKNLTDKKYTVFVSDPGTSGMVGSQSVWGEPRTYGVDLIYRYK